MEKKRIIFFGGGDFPRETFLSLILNQNYSYEIVGLVSTYDKCEDRGKTLAKLAEEYSIPYIIINSCGDNLLYEWCAKINPTLYIVMSFDMEIPSSILKIAEFNVIKIHPSLLPFLKGPNPIRWAIRNGMMKTGLTALSNNDLIIANCVVDMDEDMNYGELKRKLSKKCSTFIHFVISFYKVGAEMSQSNCGLDKFRIFNAPNMDDDYFLIDISEDFTTILRSVLPYDGIKCKFVVRERQEFGREVFYLPKKEYDCIIWALHKGLEDNNGLPIKLTSSVNGVGNELPFMIVDELQIEDGKRMNINDFVKEFKYLKNNDGKYKCSLNFKINEPVNNFS